MDRGRGRDSTTPQTPTVFLASIASKVQNIKFQRLTTNSHPAAGATDGETTGDGRTAQKQEGEGPGMTTGLNSERLENLLLLWRRQATPPSLVTCHSRRSSGCMATQCKRFVVVQMEEVSGFERTSVTPAGRKRSRMKTTP